MTTSDLQTIAEAHGFGTETREGSLYVLVPWSMKLHDGTFSRGTDAERVWDVRSLRNVLGY